MTWIAARCTAAAAAADEASTWLNAAHTMLVISVFEAIAASAALLRSGCTDTYGRIITSGMFAIPWRRDTCCGTVSDEAVAVLFIKLKIDGRISVSGTAAGLRRRQAAMIRMLQVAVVCSCACAAVKKAVERREQRAWRLSAATGGDLQEREKS